MRLSVYLLSLAALRLAAAEQVGHFNSNDCADPPGFESCYDDADSWYTDCINDNCEGQNIDCHNSCECAKQGHYTRCAASSCWNMVYSCEYQLQVDESFTACITPDLNRAPFWPAPDNANGRCSCSVGEITKAQVLINEVTEECSNQVASSYESVKDITDYGLACICCGFSGLLSIIPTFCPRLDLTELNATNLEQLLIETAPSFAWDECQQYLDEYDCAAEFGYPSDVQTYYGPGNIPEGGTETLYNIGALTTPVSETVTFTIASQLYPVTAVSTDASVPTGSTDNGNDNDSTGRSDSDSDGNGSSGSSTEDGSDAEAADSSDPPKDVAAHQISVSQALSAMAVAMLGVVYIL